MGAILLVLVAFPGTMLIQAGHRPEGRARCSASRPQLILSLVILGIAAATVRVNRGLTAVMMVGGVGYAVAVLFILRGAPDLALTQILVETVTLIAGAAGADPAAGHRRCTPSHKGNGFRAAIALAAGALMTALALIIPGTRTATPVSADLAGPAVEFGGGNEHRQRHPGRRPGLGHLRRGHRADRGRHRRGVADLPGPPHRTHARAGRPTIDQSGRGRSSRRRGWPPTGCPRRSLLLEVVTRMIFHIIVVFSVYVLFVGHDEPGGGFAAGLIVGLALALRYIAGGAFELGEAAPWSIRASLMGVGLFISSATAVYGVIAGGAALQSTILKATVPVLGDLKFVTSSIFDIGVYLIVIGLVLDVLRSMGAELDRQGVLDRLDLGDESDRDRGAARAIGQVEPMTTNLVLAITIGVLFAAGVYLMLSRNLIRVHPRLPAGRARRQPAVAVHRRATASPPIVGETDRRRADGRPDPAGADPDLDRDQPGGLDLPAGDGLPELHGDPGTRRLDDDPEDSTSSPTPTPGRGDE